MIRSHVFYGVASRSEYFEKMGKNFMGDGSCQHMLPRRGGHPHNVKLC
jgi:hypothetical protein